MADARAGDRERARVIAVGQDARWRHCDGDVVNEIAQALADERERAAKKMDALAEEHHAIAVERRDDDMEMAKVHASIAHTYGCAARAIRAPEEPA